MNLTVFILLRTQPAWLVQDRARRDAIAAVALQTAFAAPGLPLRFFDAEAFNARVSDVAVIEAGDPEIYYFAIERLRDTPLIAAGYFEVVEIIPAYENGHQTFAGQEQARVG